ncbi:MAG TPA: DUF502 domain-containing protein [Isosphaeraceae bacterium]|jgi:uncharacterized membrane protein|nr:DUF502 domain-containing protein [Isosphaeraceae bacterium]
MDDSSLAPEPRAAERKPGEPNPVRGLITSIRTRILSGLLLALPIVITLWIIYWLYSTLQGLVLNPLARLINGSVFANRARQELPFWWDNVVAPLTAIVLVLAFLYFLGYLVRTRLARAVDWVLLRVPLVTIVYKAVRNVFQALEDQGQGNRFKRVVLVAFPHPGSRALAFVTKSLQDAETQKTILCVCVLTGVMPPAGFTLFVPEEDVINVDWSVNQTLQTILSGGITAPSSIRYFGPSHAPLTAGPIIDMKGHPIDTHPAVEAHRSPD